jgi:hypothetical protein
MRRMRHVTNAEISHAVGCFSMNSREALLLGTLGISAIIHERKADMRGEWFMAFGHGLQKNYSTPGSSFWSSNSS